MKVGYIQTLPEFGNISANVDYAVKRIASLDAKLVVLPELFSTGYQFRSKAEALSLAEEVPGGYATSRLIEIARDKKTYIAAGIAERSGKKVYNSAVIVGPRGLVTHYRKAHLFSGEKKIFDPGDTPFEVHNIGGARVGLMICYDWVYPEVARTITMMGADIICHPSNLVLKYCPDAMVTRCLENGIFAITANRVGTEERIKGVPLAFRGSSQIVTPAGEIIGRASRTRQAAKIVDIDPKQARSKKFTPVNHLFKDRRVEFFDLKL